jgi:alkylation response protein AidB-like acyl-CoA dehydrogenase
VDLSYPPEAEALRAEVRAWLADNLPAEWLAAPDDVPVALRAEVTADWNRRLFAGRWICPRWPKRYGGRALSVLEAVVLDEEFARARTPLRGANLGEALVGPTLMQWGTEAQRERFLPGIIEGTETWCQGFSEPDAGSDLASLRTTARLEGDEWVIDGQKVWTSMAHEADHIFLLARTDLDAPKHKGISYLLVPMRQPGVEVRPLVRLDANPEFNEVFFSGARCPAANIVGAVNEGWRVASSTLADERGTSSTTSYHRFERELAQLFRLARDNGASADPVVRQRLAAMYTRVRIMRASWFRSLSAELAGRADPGVDALGALNKIIWSEYHRDVTELALQVMGPAGQVLSGLEVGTYIPGVGLPGAGESYPAGPWQESFFYARSETIWGGTSEIQRNIVAERVLGLPREQR